MPIPSTALGQPRPDLAEGLEEFDLTANRMGYVGLRIAPALEVQTLFGVYPKIEVAQVLQPRGETRRAPGATYSRGDVKFTKDSFECEEHGKEFPVDARNEAMWGSWFDAELISAEQARNAVLEAHEARVVAAALAVSGTAAAGTVWTDHADATPVDDVMAAILAVRNRVGFKPNAMVIEFTAWLDLIQCAQIIDRIKYSGRDDVKPSNMTKQQVAACLGIDEIIVAGEDGGGLYNSAAEGQTASLATLWTASKALVFRKSTSRNLKEPRFMNTFHCGVDGSTVGGTIESYDEKNIRGRVIRCRMDTDEKVVYPEAGQIITGLSS